MPRSACRARSEIRGRAIRVPDATVGALRVAVINGPNLNMLGIREPRLYGTETLAQIESMLSGVAAELDVQLTYFQSNSEGELVSEVQRLRDSAEGAIVNAGAYSHSSIALRDAFAAVAIPFVEVHITNVHAREPERHRLVLAGTAIGVVCGLGSFGYEAALRGLCRHLRAVR
jgi:3-dehydroquinate dehydratase-2